MTGQVDWLKKRLQEPLPGTEAQLRMMGRVRAMPDKIPDNARASAVLCLLFPIDDVLQVLLIKRTADGRAHSGQVSFPGGRQEPFDTDLRATALREAQEEVGIMSAEVEILGGLTPLYIPVSNFQVYPFIAYSEQQPKYYLSQQEVAHIIEVPVKTLFAPERIIRTDVTSPAVPDFVMNVPAYELEDKTIIWGATAMMLSELQVLLEERQDIN